MDFLHSLIRSPEACGLNRLSSRGNLFHFHDSEEAKAFRKEASPFVLDLNGTWQFRYLTDPENLTEQDFSADAPPDGFEPAEVPDCWVMRGHGNPHYTNVVMPFPELPPDIPQENPAGIYRREVFVPQDWAGRNLILHFDGADSCFFAWFNGQFAGMSKDSRGATELDVTSLAHPGRNQLSVLVLKWCDGTFLEDQDQWYLPGLSRSVYLYSVPQNHLLDIFARSTLAQDNSTGCLRLEVHAGFAVSKPEKTGEHGGWTDPEMIGRQESSGNGWKFRLRLFDAAGNAVWDEPREFSPVPPENYTRGRRDLRRQYAEYQTDIPHVAPWSAESPALYTVTVELIAPDGTVTDATGCRIGFRRYEIRNRQFLVNGQAVLILGINRHEHHDTRGKAVPYETAKRDVELIKRFHFNAVRTSHYPAAPEFYDLCDEYGLYVMDETNLESHAYYTDLTNDPRWAAAFTDRVVRNFERDKNHACIYAWSLGNESGVGANHAAMAGYLRYRDPSRLIHYEGAITEVAGGNPSGKLHFDLTDFVCPMYPAIETVLDYAGRQDDPRPVILCEYSHAMGNSNGSLKDYFHLFRTVHGVQGGFIWEWIDHGIVKYDDKGNKYWGYGGDFGDVPNDVNFVTDGLVWPDRTPHPALYEFQYLAQPAEFSWADANSGRIRIFNRLYFKDLSQDFKLRWKLETDGVVSAEKTCVLPPVPPQKAAEIPLDYAVPPVVRGTGIALRLEILYAHDVLFAKTGDVAGWEVLDVPVQAEIPPPLPVRQPVTASFRPDLAVFTCGGTQAEITASGLIRFRYCGTELLEQGPRADIWRAALDNDGIKLLNDQNHILASWKARDFHRIRRRTDQFGGTDGTVALHQLLESGSLEDNMEVQQRFRMLPDGRLELVNTFTVPESWDDLPRLGLTMEIPLAFSDIVYWGNGPFENYIDRNAGAKFGRYETTADRMYTPYIMPQSCGKRTGVFRAEFHDGEKGLRVTAPDGMEFAAMRFPEDGLFAAAHTCDLTPSDRIFVRLDLMERGVGTGSCGPDTRMEYRIRPGRRVFTLYFEGFTAGTGGKSASKEVMPVSEQ